MYMRYIKTKFRVGWRTPPRALLASSHGARTHTVVTARRQVCGYLIVATLLAAVLALALALPSATLPRARRKPGRHHYNCTRNQKPILKLIWRASYNYPHPPLFVPLFCSQAVGAACPRIAAR